MGTATDSYSNRTTEFLYRLLKTLRRSLLLSLVAVGVLLMVLAVCFQVGPTITRNDDVIAGMLGVFSISAILAGSSFYVGLKALHRR